MYETRLVGGGGRGSGLGGLGGASRGPLDIALNSLVGILLVYLAWTVVEPFWSSAVSSSRQVKLQADTKVLSEALNRYRLQNGAYRDENLEALRPFLSQTPKDPWGNEYRVDPVLRRILSGGADGKIGETPEAEASRDDHVSFYQHPWNIRVVVQQGGQVVPIEMRMDGWEVFPVQGEFQLGMQEFVVDQGTGDVFYAAPGVDGSMDLAHRASGAEQSTWLVDGQGDERSPALGGVSEFLYFQSVRHAPSPLLYRIPLAGGEIEQITTPPDRLDHPDWDGDFSPALSQEKGHLAFHSVRGTDGKTRICFVPKGKPKGPVVVLRHPHPPGRFPTWAKDGKRVFFLGVSDQKLECIPFPPKKQARLPDVVLGRRVAGYRISPDELFVLTYTSEPGSPIEIIELETGKRRAVFTDPGIVLTAGWVR